MPAFRQVADALQRGRTIEAIKEYREATGAGLKEAKEYVEEVQSRGI
jgi:ribosomal protein L7/L12